MVGQFREAIRKDTVRQDEVQLNYQKLDNTFLEERKIS